MIGTTREPAQLAKLLEQFRRDMNLGGLPAAEIKTAAVTTTPVVEKKEPPKKLTMREVVTAAMKVDSAHRTRGATQDLFTLKKVALMTHKWDGSIPVNGPRQDLAAPLGQNFALAPRRCSTASRDST